MLERLSGYRTIIAAGVALAAEIARLYGIDIGDQDGLVNSILVIGGAAGAIYGRFVATRRLQHGDPLA
jgi:hypothetical protein